MSIMVFEQKAAVCLAWPGTSTQSLGLVVRSAVLSLLVTSLDSEALLLRIQWIIIY